MPPRAARARRGIHAARGDDSARQRHSGGEGQHGGVRAVREQRDDPDQPDHDSHSGQELACPYPLSAEQCGQHDGEQQSGDADRLDDGQRGRAQRREMQADPDRCGQRPEKPAGTAHQVP